MEDMVVHTPTEEESWMLRKVLDGLGILWSGSLDAPSSWSNWDVHHDMTCYHIWEDGDLTYSSLKEFIRKGHTILSFDEAMERLGAKSAADPESVSDLESVL